MKGMNRMSPFPRDFWAEERKVRELQILSDLVVRLLLLSPLSLFESLRLLRVAKRLALNRFPDKEETYEIIYGSRFRRILRERMLISPEQN